MGSNMKKYIKGDDVKFAHTEEQAAIFEQAGWILEQEKPKQTPQAKKAD